MKKATIVSLVLLAIACNNNGDGSSTEDTTVSNSSSVENVNGNIPDTTNTITVEGGAQPTDSTTTDSVQKK